MKNEIHKSTTATKIKPHSNGRTVYLAIPYSHKDAKIRNWRACKADEISVLLINAGFAVFSPISQSKALADHTGISNGYEYWEAMDKRFIEICDLFFVVVMPGISKSVGVSSEMAHAAHLGKPIWMVVYNEKEESLEIFEPNTFTPYKESGSMPQVGCGSLWPPRDKSASVFRSV